MPKFTTPAGTTQRYISALDRNAPDSIPGTKKVYADRAAFLQAVADERACIAMGLPVWYDGIDLQVMSEPLGAKRLWSLSTSAGSAAANAAASHGRTAVIGAFVKVLSSDSSRIHSTTGVPASGVGDNDDMAWDQAAGIIYEKASGTWSILVSMYGSGGSSPVAPGAVQNLAAGTATTNSQPLSWQAPATGTGPFTYQVAYRLGTSAGAYADAGSPVSGLSATVTGLSAGTAYDYQVTAINAAGSGPAASVNDASTAAAGGTTTGIVVANRLQNPSAIGGTVPSLQTFQRAHWSHSAGAISNLKLTNLYWSTASGTMTPTNPTGTPTNTWKQWVEYPAGVFTPVLFGGSPTCVMTGAAKQVTSDAVAVTIPANTEFWVHTMNAGTGAVMCVVQLPATASVLGVRDCSYLAADASTPVHQSAGSAGSSFIGPACITGDVAAAGAKSVMLGGDSLVYGQGDITSVGSRGSSGFLPRKMDAIGASYVKLCSSGSTADQAATVFNSGNADMIAFLNVIRPASARAFSEWGINDVQQGRTQAQLLASYAIIHTVFGNGGRPVNQSTLTPRAASTDGYLTVVNQTQRTDGSMAEWLTINTAIRGLSSATIVEVANVVANVPGGVVLACPPGATPPSTDGTHLTSPMAQYAAENIAFTL